MRDMKEQLSYCKKRHSFKFGGIHRVCKSVGAWAVILFIFLSYCPAVVAEDVDETVLTVAFPVSPGINEVYEDGTYGGCVYDWLREISKYTGWKYDIKTADESNDEATTELLDGMIEGKYDIMGGMFYQEEYEQYFNYPKYIMGSNYSLLMYQKDNSDIKGYDYNTLNGKRIGVFGKAASKIERLKKFIEYNNLTCELVYYDDRELYEKCIDSGDVDLIYGSDVYMKDGYNVAVKLDSDPYYLVTSKDKPELCEQLSKAMEEIYAANPNFAEELYNKYFPDKYINSITFTDEEDKFIKECGTLKVAVIRDRYPLFYESDGKKSGIVPECLKLISNRTNLDFEYVYADTYSELVEMAASGKADIIGAFMNDDTSADDLGLIRTAGYADLDSIILRNKQSFDKQDGLTMAVPETLSLKTTGKNDSIIRYPKYEDCMEAVNNGLADYTRMPASFIEGFYTKDYYANMTIVADTNIQETLTLAMKAPANVQMYSVLSKAVNSFSDEDTAHIVSQPNLSLPDGVVTLKTVLYTNPVLVIGICVGFVFILSLMAVLFIFYSMRTKMMAVKLEKAEETSRAKSDFLSRMSHEIRTPMNAIIGLTNLAILSRDATPALKEDLNKIDSSAKFLLSILNDVLDMSKIESKKMTVENLPFDMYELIEQIKIMFVPQISEKNLNFDVTCELEDTCYLGDKMRINQVLANLMSNACKFTDRGGSVWLSVTESRINENKSKLKFSVKDTGVGINEKDIDRVFNSFEQAEGSNLRAPGTGLGLSISSSLVSLMGGDLKVKSEPGKGSEFYFIIELPIYSGKLSEPNNVADKTKNIVLDENILKNMRVLLAEDNDINAEIATELLKMKQISVDRAPNGQEAVNMFAKSSDGEYSAILMDINMPEKDGLTAAAEIRKMNRKDSAEVPILAMTANTFKEDREKAAEAGMTGFLPKPFDAEQLYKTLTDSILKK